MQVSFLQGSLKAEKNIFSFLGIYGEFSTEWRVLSKLKGLIFVGLSLLFEVSLLLFLKQNSLSWKEAINVLMLLVQQTAFICKLLVFMNKIPEIITLEKKLHRFTNDQYVVSNNKLMQQNLRKISMVGHTYRISCMICCVVFTVGPIIVNGIAKEYILPLPTFIRYEVNNTLKYAMACIFQIISFYTAGCLNSSIDIFGCKLMTIGSSLFQILSKHLNEIGTEDPRCRYKSFLNCVCFHIETLRYVKQLENIYTYITFWQFAASATVICSTAFQLITVPIHGDKFIASLMYLLNMIIEIGLYCWYGHHIQSSSDDISSACYQSHWYETDLKIKKMIIIFMENTKTPLTVTSAKVIPLSIKSLTMVLRSSYSYFAVLQRIFKE